VKKLEENGRILIHGHNRKGDDAQNDSVYNYELVINLQFEKKEMMKLTE
jgi:hypothetical protein